MDGLQMRIVRIKMAATMIVCVCHRVSDRDIAHAANHGCASYDELQDQLRVGTACGACGDCARQTFEAKRQQTAAATGQCAVSWFGRRALSAAHHLTTQPVGVP
jgi:bacterioferritin-associated ferredoxin